MLSERLDEQFPMSWTLVSPVFLFLGGLEHVGYGESLKGAQVAWGSLS